MSAAAAVEVIDLLSDNEEDTLTHLLAPRRNINPYQSRRRAHVSVDSHNEQVRHVRARNTQSIDDDDEVQVVDGATISQPLTNSSTTDNDDPSAAQDDVCLLGATGPNALEDFPHSRESCVKHPFQDNPLLHCSHCYCFVCDIVASACLSWSQHCHAKYRDVKWRKLREQWKANATKCSNVSTALNQQQHQVRAALVAARIQQSTRSSHPAPRTRQQQITQPPPPPAQSQDGTIYLNMSSVEQQSFAYSNSSSDAIDVYVTNGGTMTAVQQCLLFPDTIIATTKMNALMIELTVLKSVKPRMRVMVCTQYKSMQAACAAKLQQQGYVVYLVHSSMSAHIRSDMMNKFYNQVRPTVLITCGIHDGPIVPQHSSSLTCVYFLEPLLNASTESQLINGQQLPVKRFVFRYSMESNIMELRHAIASGRVTLENETFLSPQAMAILAKGINTQGDSSSGLLEI